MARDRLHIEAAEHALLQFDEAWPRLRELRNLEEHVLGPTLDAPAGIWYFSQFVADLRRDGGVEYVAHVERMDQAVEQLYQALCAMLVTEDA
jgi:hypothetical protein